MSNDRLVNATAEAALLGGLMLDNEKIVEVSDRVKPDDFADALNGRIYNALLRFAAKGMRADAVTLRPLFVNDSEARFGAYLEDLVASPAVKSAVDALADQVSDFAKRRDVREKLRGALGSIEDDLDVPIDVITGIVESAGWDAVAESAADIVYDAGDLIALVQERHKRIEDDPQAAGLRNALVQEFDDGLGGIERGTYNIIAGRPGMGKSALGSSLAVGFAIAGHPGIYINHEMNAEQMGIRLSADISHAMGMPIENEYLKKGTIDQQQVAELEKARQRAKLLPLRYRTPGRVDIKRIRRYVAQQKALFAAQGKSLDWVIVDLLNLVGATGVDGRQLTKGFDRVSAVSIGLKLIAQDLNVAMIALAHLSRGVEQRSDKRPHMSDLKESGDLEQDADSVTLIYREEYYLEQDKPKKGTKLANQTDAFDEWEKDYFAAQGKMDLIFAKNRHGKSSTKTAKFLAKYSAVRSGGFNEMDNEESPLLI